VSILYRSALAVFIGCIIPELTAMEFAVQGDHAGQKFSLNAKVILEPAGDLLKVHATSYVLDYLTTTVMNGAETVLTAACVPQRKYIPGPYSAHFREQVRKWWSNNKRHEAPIATWKKVLIMGGSPLLGIATALLVKQGAQKLFPEDTSIEPVVYGVILNRLFDYIPSSGTFGNTINNGGSLAVLWGLANYETIVESRPLWKTHYIFRSVVRGALQAYLMKH
jgi:hypothetical protein